MWASALSMLMALVDHMFDSRMWLLFLQADLQLLTLPGSSIPKRYRITTDFKSEAAEESKKDWEKTEM
ncbi:hypothetical protein PGTUg99_000192, partial [Puccinia graminis f. sp. tritici]